MAALPKQLPARDLHEDYSAEANVFSANLEQPIQEDIAPTAMLSLDKIGGYKYQPAGKLQVQGLISYRSGYSQVAGHPSSKRDGFTTLATAVVEDLNILDVITADRIVGQISTTHPVYDYDKRFGHVPSVTFLGTRFDNLRISGHKVEVERNLHILGPRPERDRSYFEDDNVFKRLAHQFANIHRTPDLPDWASEDLAWNEDEVRNNGEMKLSLVNSISGAPGTTFGHVIDLPHFGKIFLGELTVKREKTQDPKKEPDRYSFHLNMVRTKLGCLAHGDATAVALDSNGTGSKSKKGGGGK